MLGAATTRTPDSAMELWEDLSSELWQVQRGLGEARLMTLDELDSAYKRDEIDEHTMVRKAGTDGWRTLGAIAGIEPSSVMLESESLIPVASEIKLPEIPRPPRLPSRLGVSGVETVEDAPLTERELATARPQSFTHKVAKATLLLAAAGIVYVGTSTFLTKAYGPAPVTDAILTTARMPPAFEPEVVAAEAKPILEEGSIMVLARAVEVEPAPRVITANTVVVSTRSAAPSKLATGSKVAPAVKVAPVTTPPKVASPKALALPASVPAAAPAAKAPARSPLGLRAAPPAVKRR